MTERLEPICVNVVDMLDICTRAQVKVEANGDQLLDNAYRSVLSALVRHLGKRHADLPGELRHHYNYLLEHT